MTEASGDHEKKSISWHGATDKDKCYEMQAKYGWKLLDVKPNNDSTLKVKCIFEGETEFPNYQEGK